MGTRSKHAGAAVARVLMVDDEVNILESMKRALHDAPFEVLTAGSGAQALEILEQSPVDVVVSDENMPQMTGSELLARISRHHPSTRRIILTGQANLEAAMRAINQGQVWKYLTKPVAVEDLAQAILEAIQEKRHMDRLQRLTTKVARICSLDQDMRNNIRIWSGSARSLFLMAPGDRLEGMEDVWPRLFHEDRDQARAVFQTCLEGGAAGSAEFRIAGDQGRFLWLSMTVDALLDETGSTSRMLAVFRDITERKRHEDLLYHQAFHDRLTGIPNRACLDDHLRGLLGGKSFSLLFLDLDDFKFVNDSLGHMIGDQVLGLMARRLTGILPPGGFLARLGGDEFAVTLEEDDPPREAARLAERIGQVLREPTRAGDSDIVLTASLGITAARPGHTQPDDILREADAAMYAAKEQGKDGYQVFLPAMLHRVTRRLTLESRLRAGLESGQLQTFFQPLFSLPNLEIRGFEALVRWPSPDLGLVPPLEFIPMAEQSNLILAVGETVLRQAVGRLASLRREFPAQDLFVSVNHSGRQFLQYDLAERIQQVVDRQAIPASRVKLEITESVLIDRWGAKSSILDSLVKRGFPLVIDDFGTGYSSLSYLLRLPVQGLKIDQSFVAAMDKDSEAYAVARLVIELGRVLELEIVAEGVETEQQARLLSDLNCPLAQGYYVSRPLAGEDIQAFLQNRPALPGEDRDTR